MNLNCPKLASNRHLLLFTVPSSHAIHDDSVSASVWKIQKWHQLKLYPIVLREFICVWSILSLEHFQWNEIEHLKSEIFSIFRREYLVQKPFLIVRVDRTNVMEICGNRVFSKIYVMIKISESNIWCAKCVRTQTYQVSM